MSVPRVLLLCALAPTSLASVSLSLIPDTLTCIVNATHPGSAGNAFGYEDGSVRRVGASLHMLVSEEYAAPKWVGMRLAHWTTDAPDGDAGWTRVGVLTLDGAPMISSRNCSDVVSHTAALWSPTASYDDAEGVWFMTYVGYNCPNNWDGVIKLARSVVMGPAGIGGPYESVSTLLTTHDDTTQAWEGRQGDDSFFAFRDDEGALLALYGSSDAGSYWSVGLAHAPSGTMQGPWVRAATGNPLQVNGQRTENPIVLQVAPGTWVAVYDSIRSEGTGFGVTWSNDARTWAQGVLVPVPGGVRAPMAALAQADGSVLVIFNRQGAFDALWAARFSLHLNVTGAPP